MDRNLALSKSLTLQALLAQADLVGGATGTYIDVRHAERFSVLVKLPPAPGGATHTIQLRQAKTAAGGNAKDLGAAVVVVALAGVLPADVILDRTRDLLDSAGGFNFVGIVVTAVLTDGGGAAEQVIIAPQDVGTADVTGTYVDVTAWKSFRIVSKAGAVTAAKILTAQVKAASDAAGTGAVNQGAAVNEAGAGGNPPATIVQSVNVADLPAGKPFVTVVLRIDEDAKLGTAALVRTDRGTFGSAWIALGGRRFRP